jgi:hypothetical protein
MAEQQTDKRRQIDREMALYRYVRALDRGDLDMMAAVLEQAERDPSLEQMILETHEAFLAEEDAVAEQGAAETVRELLRRCLPSGFAGEAEEMELPPLTVSDVVGRLQADAALSALAAREEGRMFEQLRQSRAPLPEDLSKRSLRKFFEELGLSLSEKLQKLFRETAVLLSMGREQHAARLAATRRQRQQRQTEVERKESQER